MRAHRRWKPASHERPRQDPIQLIADARGDPMNENERSTDHNKKIRIPPKPKIWLGTNLPNAYIEERYQS